MAKPCNGSWEAVKPNGTVTGVDLSAAHVAAAQAHRRGKYPRSSGDVRDVPLPGTKLDFVWCVNTINHFPDPFDALNGLVARLRPGGRIALGQSSLLPDMSLPGTRDSSMH